MTATFICTECGRGDPSAACAYQIHGSTAFPDYIKDGLNCPKGYKKFLWREVDDYTFHIPMNFREVVSEIKL